MNSNQFDGGFDREIANTVCRSIHLNGAREKRLKRSKYLRLCLTIFCGLFVLFGLFVYSGYPSEYDEIDGVVSRRTHSERIKHVFTSAATHVGGKLSVGRQPTPLIHRTHQAPVWKRPCGKNLCMGDTVTINIVDLLLSGERNEGLESASMQNARAMMKAKTLKAAEETEEVEAQAPSSIMCTATVMLVESDQYIDSLIQGGVHVGPKEDAGVEKLVKVRFDGWAGQSAFWLTETDTAIVTPQARSFRGTVIEIPLSPCPFSFSTNGIDSNSMAQGVCSVAMREHCELDTDQREELINNETSATKRKQKKRKTRRAAGCTILQSRVDTVPLLWQEAQQWGHTSGVCPPSDIVVWAPDMMSHPDCSQGMRRTLQYEQLGGEKEWKTWKKAQKSLAEDGYCPDPDAYFWLPDVVTHPKCSKCIRAQCDATRSSPNSTLVGCSEIDFQSQDSIDQALAALGRAQDVCARIEASSIPNNEDLLWDSSGCSLLSSPLYDTQNAFVHVLLTVCVL